MRQCNWEKQHVTCRASANSASVGLHTPIALAPKLSKSAFRAKIDKTVPVSRTARKAKRSSHGALSVSVQRSSILLTRVGFWGRLLVKLLGRPTKRVSFVTRLHRLPWPIHPKIYLCKAASCPAPSPRSSQDPRVQAGVRASGRDRRHHFPGGAHL